MTLNGLWCGSVSNQITIDFAAGYTSVQLNVGIAMTPQTPVVVGGFGVRSYSITPALPAGLTFNSSTGTLSGTPTVASSTTTYTVLVSATATATTTFTIAVQPQMTFSYPATISAVVGSFLSPVTPPVSNGYGTRTYYISPQLPVGLRMDQTTGVISGSPVSTSSVTSYTVTVVDTAFPSNFSQTTSLSIGVYTNTVPNTVTSLAASESTSNPHNLNVSWTAPTTNSGPPVTAYSVEYSEAGANSWVTATNSVTSTSYLLFLANAGVKYDVRVSAISVAGSGSASTVTNRQPIPYFGENVYGGYYTGMIDTTSIAGSKYLVIVSGATNPLSGNSSMNSSQVWKNSATNDATTWEWDGLTATTTMYNADTSGVTFPAAFWAYTQAFPASDGGSRWYVPASFELELIYRNLKPGTDINDTGAGANSFSSPTGGNYTSNNPAQTSVAAFRTGGTHALSLSQYWSSTQRTAIAGRALSRLMGGQVGSGTAYATNSKTAALPVRPVRRVTF